MERELQAALQHRAQVAREVGEAAGQRAQRAREGVGPFEAEHFALDAQAEANEEQRLLVRIQSYSAEEVRLRVREHRLQERLERERAALLLEERVELALEFAADRELLREAER